METTRYTITAAAGTTTTTKWCDRDDRNKVTISYIQRIYLNEIRYELIVVNDDDDHHYGDSDGDHTNIVKDQVYFDSCTHYIYNVLHM